MHAWWVDMPSLAPAKKVVILLVECSFIRMNRVQQTTSRILFLYSQERKGYGNTWIELCWRSMVTATNNLPRTCFLCGAPTTAEQQNVTCVDHPHLLLARECHEESSKTTATPAVKNYRSRVCRRSHSAFLSTVIFFFVSQVTLLLPIGE